MNVAMLPTDLREGDRIPMSWEDYEALGEDVRASTSTGDLVMSQPTTLPHQRISLRLATVIDPILPDGVEVAMARAWKPGVDEFIPDLTVFDIRSTSSV